MAITRLTQRTEQEIMAMLGKTLGGAIVGGVLGVLVGSATPTQAAVFTYDFTVTATNGPLQGQLFSGSLSYDDANLIKVQNTSVALVLKPSIIFNFLGNAFNETNDLGYYSSFYFPLLLFENETLRGLNYAVTERDLTNPVEIPGLFDGFLFAEDVFEYNIAHSNEDFKGTVTYKLRVDEPETPPASVPEPSMMVGLGTLAIGYFASRQR